MFPFDDNFFEWDKPTEIYCEKYSTILVGPTSKIMK